jgi:RimJ/RimL family protein N-acetyltransferase
VELRNVRLDDVDAYVRMRCDPAMMAELGGPQPADRMPDKVRRDVAEAEADLAWIQMIVPDPADPAEVAGNVVIWTHELAGVPISEIGWMVLPEYQGRGYAKRAVRLLLARARDERRWGEVHAFPGVGNAASNGVCRSVGFRLLGPTDTEYAGQTMRTNHWVVDPATDLVT